MDTLTALQHKFKGPTAPLVDIAAEYLGLSARKASDQAAAGRLPLPAYKLGSRKSPWMVNLKDLAKLIDSKAQAARTDWENPET